MFSLIIGTITVALVALLVLATIYYGGSAISVSGYKATATKVSTEIEQIRMATQMYESDKGVLPKSLEDLTANGTYLSGIPSDWSSQSQYFTKSADTVTADVCLQFNTARGIPLVPSCNDAIYAGTIVCCAN